jgi:hypothetical protein
MSRYIHTTTGRLVPEAGIISASQDDAVPSICGAELLANGHPYGITSLRRTVDDYVIYQKVLLDAQGEARSVSVEDAQELYDIDLSRVDLSPNQNCLTLCRHWVRGNFSNSNLSNIFANGLLFTACVFDDADMAQATMTNAVLAGASLQRANLTGMNGSGTNFAGSDFRDANFTEVQLPGADLRNCNWVGVTGTRSLSFVRRNTLTAGATRHEPPHYEQFSFTEAAESFGVDDDTFRVLLWAGDIEVRDDATSALVDTAFDAHLQHVPVWQIQNPPSSCHRQ